MGECVVFGCDGDDRLSYTCRFCDKLYCSEHRLPEKHNCPGLRTDTRQTNGRWFKEGLSSHKRTTRAGVRSSPKRSESLAKRVKSFIPDWKLPGRTPDREEIIDTRSPDTAPDGSLIYQDYKPGRFDRTDRTRIGFVRSVLSWILLPFVLLGFLIRNLPAAIGIPVRWVRSHWVYVVVLTVVLATGIGFGVFSASDVLPDPVGDQVDEALSGLVNGGAEEFDSLVSIDQERSSIASGNTELTDGVDTSKSEGRSDGTSVDAEEVSTMVHAEINRERRSRGLSPLEHDSQLAGIAEYHSQDMGRHGYFSHDSPSGESMADRYDKFGYDCRVPTGGQTYALGAENIGKMSTRGYTPDESTIAAEIVEGWMASPGHRENILTPYWRREGIGVSVENGGSTTILVTQNFC